MYNIVISLKGANILLAVPLIDIVMFHNVQSTTAC